MLIQGDNGESVANLQKNLNQIGCGPLKADGQFGPATFVAVQSFQSVHSLPITGQVDEDTYRALDRAIASQFSTDEMPWLSWMRKNIGEVEQTGSKATAFDDEVFSHTSYGNLDGVMQAGCAATACAALEESGYKSPHNAAAESFRNYGTACDLKPGCIVGFNWKHEKGVHCDHVSICDHIIDDAHVACIGGNQGHQVKVSIFTRAAIDFTRWPEVGTKEVKTGN